MGITTIELLLYGILGWMVVIAGIDLVKALASAEQYKEKGQRTSGVAHPRQSGITRAN
jgi:hypothetical protein